MFAANTKAAQFPEAEIRARQKQTKQGKKKRKPPVFLSDKQRNDAEKEFNSKNLKSTLASAIDAIKDKRRRRCARESREKLYRMSEFSILPGQQATTLPLDREKLGNRTGKRFLESKGRLSMKAHCQRSPPVRPAMLRSYAAAGRRSPVRSEWAIRKRHQERSTAATHKALSNARLARTVPHHLPSPLSPLDI